MSKNLTIAQAPKSSRRTFLVLGILLVLWLCSVPLACMFGPVPISAGDVGQILLQTLGFDVKNSLDSSSMPASTVLVVRDIRLARSLLALVVGGSLALAGVAMQGVLHNPLAEPFLLGVSSGAALGAGTVIAFGVPAFLGGAMGTVLSSVWGTAQGAMLGAFLALGLSLLLGGGGKLATQGTGRDRLILAGVAVSTMFGAGVSLIKALDEESVSGIVFWILGSFQGRGWADMPLALVPSAIGLLLLLPCWRALDILTLGDADAAHLGVNVRRVRLAALLGAGCLTAGSVAVSGIIGFVGLVAPHILRRLMGHWHGPLFLAAWLGGGLFLLWADVAARSLPHGLELPVGVITSLAGGPFFALLLWAQGRKRKVS